MQLGFSFSEEQELIRQTARSFAAERVAERCRALLFKEQITHANSPVSQLLTISLRNGSRRRAGEAGRAGSVNLARVGRRKIAQGASIT